MGRRVPPSRGRIQRRRPVGGPGGQRAGDPRPPRTAPGSVNRRRDRRAQVHRVPVAQRARRTRVWSNRPRIGASTNWGSGSYAWPVRSPGGSTSSGRADRVCEELAHRARRDGQPRGDPVALRGQSRPGPRSRGGGGAELGRAADSTARHLQRQDACWPICRGADAQAAREDSGQQGVYRETRSPPGAPCRRSSAPRAEDGYATTFEEYEDGLNAIAAPIRDHTGGSWPPSACPGPAYRLGKRLIAS